MQLKFILHISWVFIFTSTIMIIIIILVIVWLFLFLFILLWLRLGWWLICTRAKTLVFALHCLSFWKVIVVAVEMAIFFLKLHLCFGCWYILNFSLIFFEIMLLTLGVEFRESLSFIKDHFKAVSFGLNIQRISLYFEALTKLSHHTIIENKNMISQENNYFIQYSSMENIRFSSQSLLLFFLYFFSSWIIRPLRSSFFFPDNLDTNRSTVCFFPLIEKNQVNLFLDLRKQQLAKRINIW